MRSLATGLPACAVACAALLAGSPARAHPYLALRPADQILGGPTDGALTSLHYNPAALRLATGSQFMVVGGARGYLGSFQRSASLPAGFGPSSQEAAAQAASIRWASPDMMVAGSWDLRSDAVTLGLGLYTPYVEDTNYVSGDPSAPAPTARSPELKSLGTRYHAVSSHTYSLWGALAVSLRLRSFFYLGAGFNFAWTHTRMVFLRDLDGRADAGGPHGPNPPLPPSDNLACSGPGPCEQWSQRQSIEFDGSGWGYGFTTGILIVPLEGRLWLSLSYVSPLFTTLGAAVGLDGAPEKLPWQAPGADDPCGGTLSGARIAQRDGPASCGAARLVRSFPHLLYLGARGRLSAATWRSSRHPSYIELVGWARLYVPPREDVELVVERRLLPQGRVNLPLSQRTAVALTFGLRQHWPRLTLGQELLYESPRTDTAVVSPANLEGHKLDASFAARVRLHRRLALQFNIGVTGVLMPADAGSGFSPALAEACRDSQYDVSTAACQAADRGLAVPKAEGSYTLVVPHGSAGFEVSL